MNILYKNLKLTMILFTLFTLSCENPFNPKQESNVVNDGYLPNDIPENILKNLENAYNRKDIELYKLCLSGDFRFELISSEASEINSGVDLDDDGLADSWWGYQQEVDYHTNLFREGSTDGRFPPPDEVVLVITRPPVELWQDDDEVGHEGWKVVTCGFDLTLKFFNFQNQHASGYATFYLKPQNDKWYIAIWRDESNI